MPLQVAGGSVPGTDHIKPGQPGRTNNQDAFHWIRSDRCLTAVVCDGCSSGAHSEVGAKIGARLLAQAIAEAGERYVAELGKNPGTVVSVNWERAKMDVLSHISIMAKAMGGSFSQTITDYFLFTMVGALVTEHQTFVFSLGDGVFVINGQLRKIGPFPGNEPPYLAYNLTGSSVTEKNPSLLKIAIMATIPTKDLTSLLVGSDGVMDLIEAAEKTPPQQPDKVVGDISQFWIEDRFFSNPDSVRRRLNVINREHVKVNDEHKGLIAVGLLPDDTTLIVIRQTNENGGI